MIELEISGLVYLASKLLELQTEKTSLIKFTYYRTNWLHGRFGKISPQQCAGAHFTGRWKRKTPTKGGRFQAADISEPAKTVYRRRIRPQHRRVLALQQST